MTQPVTPWSEYARSEWARIGIELSPDPLRPPATDEEPWRLEDLDLLDGAVVWSAVWLYAVAIAAAALVAVLVLLGLRRVVIR